MLPFALVCPQRVRGVSFLVQYPTSHSFLLLNVGMSSCREYNDNYSDKTGGLISRFEQALSTVCFLNGCLETILRTKRTNKWDDFCNNWSQ